MTGFNQDITYAWRTMRQRPGFTGLVVAALALGIGANTAVFSIVNAVLLRPLPYKDSSRLVAIWDRNVHADGVSKMFDSFRDFETIAEHARVFDEVAAATWAVGPRLLSGLGTPREVLAMPVSQSFFRLLGVVPSLRRTFTDEDLKRGCTVVLSHHLWSGPVASDSAVIGKSIVLDDQQCLVVGVMKPGFAFYPEAAQLWILLTPGFSPPPAQLPIGIFARLKPGTTVAQAQAEVTALHTALHSSDGSERDLVPVIHDLQQEFTFLADAGLRTTLWLLLAAVGFVLLITCLNVANLLLGQALGRERELAVRAALGCGRGRLIRQLLTEGLVLASIGGLLGTGLAFAAVHYFTALNPVEMPVGSRANLSLPVLAFTAALSLSTVLMFGLIPALKSSRLNVVERLKAGAVSIASGRQRTTRVLIAAEIAVSLMLLAGAALLFQSVLAMTTEPLGFEARGLAVTSLSLPSHRYSDPAHRLQFFDRLGSVLGSNGALSTALPPYGAGSSVAVHVEGAATDPHDQAVDTGQQIIDPEYFKVLGISLVRGRTFEAHDRLSSDAVVIINQALARKLFQGADPIGRRISIGTPNQTNPWRTVVGLVANDKRSTNYHQIGWVERPIAFKPIAQDPPRSVSIVTRGRVADISSVIAGIDPLVAASETETMDKRLARFLAYPRFRAALLSAFALFATLLAALGLFGVLRQWVAQRTQEIGIRMALGARPIDVLLLIAAQGGRPVVAGLIAGWVGAAVLTRYLSSLLYGVRSGDPATFVVVALTLLLVATVAAFLPARRAARVDPMQALRNE